MSHEKVSIVDNKKRRSRVDVFAMGPDMKILVTYHGNIIPELPGGGIDEGESVIEAARRELMEESGWTANGFREIKLNKDYIVNASINDWLKKIGFDEEFNHVVICSLDKFNPNHRYKSEGDARDFKLEDLKTVYENSKTSLFQNNPPRLLVLSEMRIEAIEQIYSEIGNLPAWTKW